MLDHSIIIAHMAIFAHPLCLSSAHHHKQPFRWKWYTHHTLMHRRCDDITKTTLSKSPNINNKIAQRNANEPLWEIEFGKWFVRVTVHTSLILIEMFSPSCFYHGMSIDWSYVYGLPYCLSKKIIYTYECVCACVRCIYKKWVSLSFFWTFALDAAVPTFYVDDLFWCCMEIIKINHIQHPSTVAKC